MNEDLNNKQVARLLWKEFADVPIDEDDKITCEWRSFPKGTNRFDIWKWFEKFFEVSVVEDLMPACKRDCSTCTNRTVAFNKDFKLTGRFDCALGFDPNEAKDEHCCGWADEWAE